MLFLFVDGVVDHGLGAAQFQTVLPPALVGAEAALVEVVREYLFVNQLRQLAKSHDLDFLLAASLVIAAENALLLGFVHVSFWERIDLRSNIFALSLPKRVISVVSRLLKTLFRPEALASTTELVVVSHFLKAASSLVLWLLIFLLLVLLNDLGNLTFEVAVLVMTQLTLVLADE